MEIFTAELISSCCVVNRILFWQYLIIEVLLRSPESNFTASTRDSILHNDLENDYLKITATSLQIQ